jgi:hypothetical protein
MISTRQQFILIVFVFSVIGGAWLIGYLVIYSNSTPQQEITVFQGMKTNSTQEERQACDGFIISKPHAPDLCLTFDKLYDLAKKANATQMNQVSMKD